MKKAFPKNNFELGFSVQKQLYGREVFNFPDFFRSVVFFYSLRNHHKISPKDLRGRILYKIKIHDHGLCRISIPNLFCQIFYSSVD